MDGLCNRLMKNPFLGGTYGVDPLLAAGGPVTFVATYGAAILSTYKNKQQRKT
jgi:hypothetical protein